jgi:hypothetical protein
MELLSRSDCYHDPIVLSYRASTGEVPSRTRPHARFQECKTCPRGFSSIMLELVEKGAAVWNSVKNKQTSTHSSLCRPCHSSGFPPRRPVLEPRSGHMGFVVEKVVLKQVFSEFFGFLCEFSFHRLRHTHRLSSECGTIGQLVAAVPSRFSLSPPQEIKKCIYIKANSS